MPALDSNSKLPARAPPDDVAAHRAERPFDIAERDSLRSIRLSESTSLAWFLYTNRARRERYREFDSSNCKRDSLRLIR